MFSSEEVASKPFPLIVNFELSDDTNIIELERVGPADAILATWSALACTILDTVVVTSRARLSLVGARCVKLTIRVVMVVF